MTDAGMTDAEMIDTRSWYQRGYNVELNGHQIFAIDEGPKHASCVLLIHGFPTSSWDWCKIWEPLTRDFRVITIDMLGFGFSAKPKGHAYNIMEQADIVEAFIQHSQLQEFHVFAHDYGDTVAQELLARQNQQRGVGRWLSLCLLNGGLFPETHRAVLNQKILLSRVGFLMTKLMSQKQFNKTIQGVFGPNTQASNAELDGFWELMNFNDGRQNFHKLIHYINDRRKNRDRWVKALAEALIPVALINGSSDPVSGKHMVARYLELLGEPDYLVELDAIGHWPQVEAPEQVHRHYLEFIDRVPLSQE